MPPGCDNNAAFVGRSSVFGSFSLAAMCSLVMPQLGREAGVGYSNTVQQSWFCIMITSMLVVFVNECWCGGLSTRCKTSSEGSFCEISPEPFGGNDKLPRPDFRIVM